MTSSSSSTSMETMSQQPVQMLEGVQDQRPMLHTCRHAIVDEKAGKLYQIDNRQVFIISDVPFRPTLIVERKDAILIHGVHGGYEVPTNTHTEEKKREKRHKPE